MLRKVRRGLWIDLDTVIEVRGHCVVRADGGTEIWDIADADALQELLERDEHARNVVAWYYGVPVTAEEMADQDRMRQIRECCQ